MHRYHPSHPMSPTSPEPWLVAAASLLAVAVAAPAQPLTDADCDAHRAAIRQAIEDNRVRGLRDLEDAVAAAVTPQERSALRAEQDRLWDHEEQQIAVADTAWRDCRAHVRRLQVER
jgi:hypothetical protein